MTPVVAHDSDPTTELQWLGMELEHRSQVDLVDHQTIAEAHFTGTRRRLARLVLGGGGDFAGKYHAIQAAGLGSLAITALEAWVTGPVTPRAQLENELHFWLRRRRYRLAGRVLLALADEAEPTAGALAEARMFLERLVDELQAGVVAA